MRTVWIAAGEEPDPLMPHMSELIVGSVAFALLFFFLKKFVWPMFEQTYQERTEKIKGGLEQAESAQVEAQQALEQYRSQLAEAREEAARIRADAQRQGQEILAEMKAEAQAEANRILERANTQISAERDQALRSLRSEVGTLATDLAGRVVGESLTDEERASRVVERFLVELESADASSVGTPSSNGEA
jgi:F-type H+-transporting ATPase subunit b